MTTIEKIKAEIDKRYAEYREKMKSDDFTYYEGMADALDLFEQFIDSLESEKPMEQEGLEEELDRFIASGKSVTVEDCGTYKVSYHDFKKVARHFAKWGAEHLKK